MQQHQVGGGGRPQPAGIQVPHSLNRALRLPHLHQSVKGLHMLGYASPYLFALTRTSAHHPQDLLQRSEALQMLVDVQMEAEGWGKEQRAGALAGLTVTSAQSLMQARRGRWRSAGGRGGAGSSGRVRWPASV